MIDKGRVMRVGAILILSVVLVASAAGEDDPVVGTRWTVKGAGWWENFRLKRQLQFVMASADGLMGSNDVEDAVMLLLTLQQRRGHLDAEAFTRLTPLDGQVGAGELLEMRWDSGFETFFEREIRFERVEFHITPGPRFFYRQFEVSGTKEMDKQWISSFFFKPLLLFQGERARLFTQGGLEGSCRNLQFQLNQMGYLDARVEGIALSKDREIGAVDVQIDVEMGPMHYLVAVDLEDVEETTWEGVDFRTWVGRSYSRELRQDVLQYVRNYFFQRGYPDLQLETELLREPQEDGTVACRLVVVVQPGPVVRVGTVHFRGLKRTRMSFVARQVAVRAGDLLDPVVLDVDRLKLSRLGIFNRIDYMRGDEGALRDVEFVFEERYPWTVDLMAGWGSYEQFWAGTSVTRENLWGQAHRLQFRGSLSVKSKLGELTYSIPNIRRTGVNLSSKVFALDREEVSFDRREQGVDLALTRRFERFRLDSTLVFTRESLKSLDLQRFLVESDENSEVSSLALRLNRDKRDSPINPQRGNRTFSNLEWADALLGSKVEYTSFELSHSRHGSFGGGLFWHAGLRGGVVSSRDGLENFIPNNKLFFPGGDDSIRGYQRGEAAPRDGGGFLVGARSYVLINVELEQYLTERISVLFFYDLLGTARRSILFGQDESLDAVGIGLRWKSIIGPIRLEYGHNLRARPGDPSGTVHLALGLPF
jgi:outer membrane protein insertion porin family